MFGFFAKRSTVKAAGPWSNRAKCQELKGKAEELKGRGIKTQHHWKICPIKGTWCLPFVGSCWAEKLFFWFEVFFLLNIVGLNDGFFFKYNWSRVVLKTRRKGTLNFRKGHRTFRDPEPADVGTFRGAVFHSGLWKKRSQSTCRVKYLSSFVYKFFKNLLPGLSGQDERWRVWNDRWHVWNDRWRVWNDRWHVWNVKLEEPARDLSNRLGRCFAKFLQATVS